MGGKNGRWQSCMRLAGGTGQLLRPSGMAKRRLRTSPSWRLGKIDHSNSRPTIGATRS